MTNLESVVLVAARCRSIIGALIRASLTGREQFGEVFLRPFIRIQWPRFRTCALPMDVLSIADARSLRGVSESFFATMSVRP